MLSGSRCALDTAESITNHKIARGCRRCLSSSGVSFEDCGETAHDGGDCERSRSEIRDVEGDRLRSGRHEVQTVRFAPASEVVPV